MAFGLGYAVVYGPYVEAYKELLDYLSDGSNVMYGAFHRLIWAIAVGWVVYACQNGFGGKFYHSMSRKKVSFILSTVSVVLFEANEINNEF